MDIKPSGIICRKKFSNLEIRIKNPPFIQVKLKL